MKIPSIFLTNEELRLAVTEFLAANKGISIPVQSVTKNPYRQTGHPWEVVLAPDDVALDYPSRLSEDEEEPPPLPPPPPYKKEVPF